MPPLSLARQLSARSVLIYTPFRSFDDAVRHDAVFRDVRLLISLLPLLSRAIFIDDYAAAIAAALRVAAFFFFFFFAYDATPYFVADTIFTPPDIFPLFSLRRHAATLLTIATRRRRCLFTLFSRHVRHAIIVFFRLPRDCLFHYFIYFHLLVFACHILFTVYYLFSFIMPSDIISYLPRHAICFRFSPLFHIYCFDFLFFINIRHRFLHGLFVISSYSAA